MKRAEGFTADDGAWFSTAAECKAHERETGLRLLRGLTDEQVNGALARSDIPLADAIEFAGNLIAEKRRADGDLKRKKKSDPEKNVGLPSAADVRGIMKPEKASK